MANPISSKIAERAINAAASALASEGVRTGFGAARADQARMYALASTIIDDAAIDLTVFGKVATADELERAKRFIASSDDLERLWDDHARRLAKFADVSLDECERLATGHGWYRPEAGSIRLDHADRSWQTAHSWREACAISLGNAERSSAIAA